MSATCVNGMIRDADIQVWACAETARAHALQPDHVLRMTDSMPLGVHVLLADAHVPDIADAARAWSLAFPMTFLVWVRGAQDADKDQDQVTPPPEMDFTIEVKDRSKVKRMVMDWLYADARFTVADIDVAKRTFCTRNINEDLFHSAVDLIAARLQAAGATRVKHASKQDVSSGRVMEVYLGPLHDMQAAGCFGTGVLWLCLTEQPQGFDSEYVRNQDLLQHAEQILACSHVIARHIRCMAKRVSITPVMWARFHDVTDLIPNQTRSGALQFGTHAHRRQFIHRLCEASRTHEPDQFQNLVNLTGAKKRAALASTRICYVPNSHERPAFTPVHRIAEVMAYGPLIITEQTDDTVTEALFTKLGHVVCAYGQLPRVIQAGLATDTHAHASYTSAQAMVDAALQATWHENWLKQAIHAAQNASKETSIRPVQRQMRTETSRIMPKVVDAESNANAQDAYRIATIALGVLLGAVIIGWIVYAFVTRK